MAREPRLNPLLPNLTTQAEGVTLEHYDICEDRIIGVRHETTEALMADLDERWAALRASLERWARLPHEERLARLAPSIVRGA